MLQFEASPFGVVKVLLNKIGSRLFEIWIYAHLTEWWDQFDIVTLFIINEFCSVYRDQVIIDFQ